jgi:hypothetical protein
MVFLPRSVRDLIALLPYERRQAPVRIGCGYRLAQVRSQLLCNGPCWYTVPVDADIQVLV